MEKATSMKSHILTNEDQKLFTAGKLYVAYHGLIHYDNAFGVSHWVQFCQTSDLVGLAQSTEEFRGIDACQRYQKTDTNIE